MYLRVLQSTTMACVNHGAKFYCVKYITNGTDFSYREKKNQLYSTLTINYIGEDKLSRLWIG